MPHRDGNKRIGFLAMAIFLELNGHRLEVPEREVVQVMVGVAGGQIAEERLATWLRAHLVRVLGEDTELLPDGR